jgi:saccharopine dehydrogenase-like NADP-dependent oxidoreductase
MKNLLIIGAGRSATALINYILGQARLHDFYVTVSDADIELARKKVNDHTHGRAIWLDASKPNDRREVIARHDVVVSLASSTNAPGSRAGLYFPGQTHGNGKLRQQTGVPARR